MNILSNLNKSGPCNIRQVCNRISCFGKDIRAVACDNGSIVKRNSVVYAVLHRIGLFQSSKIIPVNVYIAEIRESIRIAGKIFLIAVILHQYNICHRAVISCICAGRQLGLAVVR